MGGQGGILAAILKLSLRDTTILVTLTLLIRPNSLYRVFFNNNLTTISWMWDIKAPVLSFTSSSFSQENRGPMPRE